MFPKTNHTPNCIVPFWRSGCLWFCVADRKAFFHGRMIWFLIERRKGSLYQLWDCLIVIIIIKRSTWSFSIFLVPCESKQTEGMHADSCETNFIEEHPCPGYWAFAYKYNKWDADLKTSTHSGSPNTWQILLKVKSIVKCTVSKFKQRCHTTVSIWQ